MGMFRRFRTIMEAKANAVANRIEDPSEAIDLAYTRLLDEQRRLREGFVTATVAQRRLQVEATNLDNRLAKLSTLADNSTADNAPRLASQSAVLTRQREALTPQLATLEGHITKMRDALQRYDARLQTFSAQRLALKASYEAAKASSTIGDAILGIGTRTADTALLMERANDRIVTMQARADVTTALLDDDVLADEWCPA